MYSIIAIVIASVGLIYVPRHIRAWNREIVQPLDSSWNKTDILAILLCLAAAIAAWIWGIKLALPAYDEVFSAENAAGIHPFQTISYYMLPNNHLLYNLINNLLFHWATDKVATGRIISLLAYCTLIISLFCWFRGILQNRWLAVLVSITLVLQLPIWGFSFQARGYGLYLLAEWGMFISLFCYLQQPHRRWLILNMSCIAVGYFCLPSFLYLHAAQMVFMLLYALLYKKKQARFWKYQLAAILLTYLCYLPALCFSGLDVMVHNTYVIPMAGAKTIGSFVQWMFPFFSGYITHLFTDIHWNTISLNLVLFLLPVTLLFSKKNRLFGLFYVSMWVVFLLIVIIMKRVPFERNLLGHYSITLAGVILVAYWATGLQARANKAVVSKWILFPAIVLSFAVHFIRTNETSLTYALYEYDVNPLYIEQDMGLKLIPPGSTVACSDESFYCLYVCSKHGCTVSKCVNGNEDYYIMKGEEQLPVIFENRFAQVGNVGGYAIYKRK